MAEAARRFLPAREVSRDEAKILSHGGPLDPTGTDGPVAVFAADGALLAVVSDRDGRAKPEIVVAPAP
jgi:tRNA pseudouridine55 synthase